MYRYARFSIVLLAGLFLFTACGGPETEADLFDAGTVPGSGGGGGGGTTVEIQGKPAAEYFGQFVWDTTGQELSGAVAFPEQSDGKNLYRATLFLRADRTFVLFYAEGNGTVTSTGSSGNYDPSTYTRVKGSWSVQGAELLVGSGFRCGGGVRFNGQDTLSCSLTEAVLAEAAEGRSGTYRLGFDASPEDSKWAEYIER